MAVLFMDSFDHYVSADITKKWTSLSVTAISAANGRNGTASARMSNYFNELKKTLTAKQTHIIGVALRISAYPASNQALISLYDGATTQCDVRITSAGKLLVTRAGTQLGTTGTTILSLNTFYYIEFKCKIDNTTGTTEVHINTVAEANLTTTGQDTQNTANATADTLKLGDVNNGGTAANVDWDDLYWCDNSGAQNNDFLGDCRVQALLPSGAGGNTQWTPLSGANYTNVDEAAPNDDTDYVSDATVGDRDTYAYGDLASSTGNVKAIQTMHYARKDDAGTRTIAPVVRIGATNYDQANLPNLSTSYQYLPQIEELSPASGIAYTVSEINGAEFGTKVIA